MIAQRVSVVLLLIATLPAVASQPSSSVQVCKTTQVSKTEVRSTCRNNLAPDAPKGTLVVETTVVATYGKDGKMHTRPVTTRQPTAKEAMDPAWQWLKAKQTAEK